MVGWERSGYVKLLNFLVSMEVLHGGFPTESNGFFFRLLIIEKEETY